ncbi:ABC transporter permease [Kibdelosporangium philippinense]|uniref:ABC transporter permease n=1 Tax=Kibdelosporangium philippinense TaxID=211113 RepID=A0ABS8ZTH3_9PSEU|nr:FtsX-like permease family protein [Kibdelosporangium philippinense]MCE7011009.1 ABC transporter permease [Kibdelosporangium philippinense]
MLRVVLAGLKARTARLILCMVAIALGVTFVTGAMTLGDAVKAELRAQAAASVRNVDVQVEASAKRLETKALDAVRAVPGVAAADWRDVSATPIVEGRTVKDAAATTLATDDRLRPFDLVKGRYPASAAEVAVDERAGYEPGQQITLMVQGQQTPFTVVGTIKPLVTSGDLGGSGTQVTLLPEVLHSDEHSKIVVRAAPDTSRQALASAISKVVSGAKVQTGAQAEAELVRQTPPGGDSLGDFLTAFAILASAVAVLVIHNTFTILIAQRSSELALLRCIGAGRRQVFMGVVGEALGMGIVASLIGFLAGLGLSAALQGSLGQDVYMPIATRTIVAAFAVGVLVTLFASVLPARRATAVAPIAALRALPDGDVQRTSKKRVAAAVVLFALGVLAAIVGVPNGQDGAAIVGLGILAFFGAVLALGPVLVGPFVRTLGALPRRIFGTTGVLATANADRNPRRTAATTAALTICLMVVILVTTVTASVEQSTNDAVNKQFVADYSVVSAISGQALPESLVTRLGEVATTTPMYNSSVSLDTGGGASLTGVQGDVVGTLLRPAVISGSLDRIGPGDIALSQEFAKQSGLTVGQTVTADRKLKLTVTGIYEAASGPGADIGLTMVDMSTARQLETDFRGYDAILVKLKPGITAAQLEQVVATSPLAQMRDITQLRDQMTESLRDTLAVLWALIGLAVVVALAGIANTLSLSVLERTRESALLRALGLTRGGLGGTLVIEAGLITGVGAILGLVLGIGGAWLIVLTASTDAAPITLTVPFVQIVVLLGAAVLAAPLATLPPARKAAKGQVTEGLAVA